MLPCEMGRYIAGFSGEARKYGALSPPTVANRAVPAYESPDVARRLPSRDYGQPDEPQIARHGMEIAIVVKQWCAVLDTPGADQQVDGLADGDAAPAQGT